MDHTGHYTLDVEPGMPEGHEVLYEGKAPVPLLAQHI